MHNFTDLFRQNDSNLENFLKQAEPLGRAFGLDVFFYNAIEENGQFASICTHTDAMGNFWESRRYQDMGFYVSPECLKEGYFFLDHDVDYASYVESVSRVYPLYHPFLIIKKEGSKAHLFGFASKKPIPALPSLYINGLAMLDSFIHHYLQTQKPLDPILDIAKLRGQKTFYGKMYGEDSLPKQSTSTSLLTQLGVPTFLIHSAQKLTDREKEVLSAYLDHKSAKEHGQELGLSYRTIQSYIANIKNKLGVLTRDELLEQGMRLKMAGFLHIAH